MSADTDVPIGGDFLGYEIEASIGQGGMGVVYLACDKRLRRRVALKVMAPELALDGGFRERFARESELAMSLEHPNVVPIHDAGEADGRLYLAMRCVDGSDLRALLRKEGAVAPERALAIVRQIASALDAAHAKGLVHRDVKPSNVLLDASEHVYLADFGLTRRQSDDGAQLGDGRSLGTPGYLAPEQLEGGRIDGRADVYSLGCLLFECLTGQPPFPGVSRLEVAWAHLEEHPPSASERKPELPAAIDDVICKAMAKQADDRYPTCAELVTAAKNALGADGWRTPGLEGEPRAEQPVEPASAREVRKLVTVLICELPASPALDAGFDPTALRRTQSRFFDDARAALERRGATVESPIGDAIMAVFGVPQAHEDDAMRAARAAVDVRRAAAALGLQARIDVTTASYTPRDLSDEILSVRSAIKRERKQVTVLFCDIVRSSGPATKAGSEEHDRFKDRFFALALDEIHRYEGTVNQFLDDGFMALFGAPIAHEDHARRAALAALGVKERADIDVRIGINSGSVVVGAIDDDLRTDYSGDTTVLAARLQADAHPGDVLVSSETAEYLRGYFDLEETEPVAVNERTVQALRVIGRGPRTSPIDNADQQLTPFSGREAELESLQQALRAATEGEGQVVGLSGDPGLGKSRLARELRRAVETDTVVLEGRCLPFGSAVPYLPILDLVRQACCIESPDDRERVAERIQATLEKLQVDPDLGSYLHHALDVTSGGEQLAALDPATIKGRTFEALRKLLLAKAGRSLLVVIEDMQWIDRISEEFLTELVDDLPSVPMLLLTTYRPGYNSPWIGKSFATQVALRPLSKEASERVVAWVLRDQSEAAAEIVARGEGNPFFLEELAHAARHQTNGGSGRPVPRTVHDVLAARIDRLDAEEKSAVQVAAVLGREFSLDLIEEVWDGDGPLLPALDELKRCEFLQERRGRAERMFVFKHALTREVSYDGLLEERRRYLHARAGAALERSHEGRLHETYELLAFHYSRSAERERAAKYLELANRKAAARHAMEEALGYFYDALAILEDLPDSEENRRRRLTLVLDQTAGFHYLHRHAEFHELLVRHEPLALGLRDNGLLGAFYDRLAHRQLVFGDYEQARETALQALELCERAGNLEHAALACNELQWAHMMLGDYDRAHAYAERAHEHLAVSFHAMAYMYARTGAALTHMMAGRWDDALHEIEEALVTGTARSDSGMLSFANAIGALVCLEKRNWTSALEYATAAREIAPTVYFRGFAVGYLASALCHAGAAHDGVPMLEQIVPMAKASRHELAWTFLAWPLADAYMAAGDLARARETLIEIHESAANSKAKFFLGGSGRCLAQIALAEGNAEEALHRLGPAIETLRASGSESELGLALGALARAQRLNGDEAEAAASFDEALGILDRLGTLEEPDRLRHELATQAV